jgi:hypothetical protein
MPDLGHGPGPVDVAVFLYRQPHAPESQDGQGFFNLWHVSVKHEFLSPCLLCLFVPADHTIYFQFIEGRISDIFYRVFFGFKGMTIL